MLAVAECVLPPPPPEGNAPQGRPLGQTAISGAVTIGGRVSGESCLAGTRSFFIARQLFAVKFKARHRGGYSSTEGKVVIPICFWVFGRPENPETDWDDKPGLPRLVIPVRPEGFWPFSARKPQNGLG